MVKNKYCLINPQGGLIKVKIKATNGIVAKAKFVLFNSENIKQTEFTLISDDTGTDHHTMTQEPIALQLFPLAWKIWYCTQFPSKTPGKIVVNVYQNGQSIWQKTELVTPPNCDGGEEVLGRHIVFIHRTISKEKNELWTDIS